MSTDAIIESLKDQLSKSGRACNLRIAGGKQISTRCPYCGDSGTSSHTHFYIQTIVGQPLLYNCFRCPAQGIVTRSTLYDLGLDSYNLGGLISDANKQLTKSRQTNFTVRDVVKKQITMPPTEINELTAPKIIYLSQRLDIKLDEEHISKFKIVLDLDKFLEHNKITITRDKKIETLNKYYIGFLSNDSNFITFRNITNDKHIGRYFDLKITDEMLFNSRKFFNISSTIDIMSPTMNIHLGEGAIDILGIYYYYNEPNTTNDIFIGCAGKNYNGPINHFIRQGMLNLDITIYSDTDTPPSSIKDIISGNRLLKSVNHTIKLIYNDVGDDFGYPKDQIKLKRRTI